MSTERNDLIHQAKANSKIKIGIVCCRAIIGKTKIWNKTKPAKRRTNKKKEVDEERCEKEGTISLCIYFMNEGLLYTFTLQYINTFEYSKCFWKIKYLQIHIFISWLLRFMLRCDMHFEIMIERCCLMTIYALKWSWHKIM